MEITSYETNDRENAVYTIRGDQTDRIDVLITAEGEWEIRRDGQLADVVSEDNVDNLVEQPDLDAAYGVALDATGGDEELSAALILVLGQEGR